ncbi:MAG: small multi-drug export protein, partial [Coriobacteriia bacterium]|nr:small multi-drug export protein [Coriobacteriia bacterium]
FPTYFILEWIYDHIPEGSWLHRKLENVRAKAHPLVEKYGFFGLALFVGIPLPGTGAYSGSCAAWLLDMEWRRALVAVALGVLIALTIVWILSAGLFAGLELL